MSKVAIPLLLATLVLGLQPNLAFADDVPTFDVRATCGAEAQVDPGAGAVRSGLPSLFRGMPLVGTFSHCATAGMLAIIKIADTREPVLRFIAASKWAYLSTMCFRSFSFSLQTYSSSSVSAANWIGSVTVHGFA